MKKTILILYIFFPSLLSAQFDDKELYGYTRINLDIGMRDFKYTSNIDGHMKDAPIVSTLKLSSGITTEIGVGFMMLSHFFVEGNVSYTLSQKKVYHSNNTDYYLDRYTFNRVNIGVNGVYFIDIDNYTTIYGNAGFRAILPQSLEVTTSHNVEKIRYRAAMGFTTGFGGNYNNNNFIYGVGLHFQMANLKVVPNQDLPSDFEALNPGFNKLKLRSMVLSFTVKYLF